MTCSYVRHDSFLCKTWLIQMRDMTHSYVRHDSFTCETSLIPMWDTAHAGARWVRMLQCVAVRYSVVRCAAVCWNVLQCAAQSHVTWLTLNECSAGARGARLNHSNHTLTLGTRHVRKDTGTLSESISTFVCIWHDSFTCVEWLRPARQNPHLWYVWHDSFTCVV